MQPRLRFDIGWRDLMSICLPVRSDEQALTAVIAARAPSGTVAVVGLSVRSLFDAILSEVAEARPVAMSAVNIADMAALVRAHGCEVRPIDIGLASLAPTAEAVAMACRGDAGIVVLAHLYGKRNAVEPLEQAGNPPRRLVIEDCAQAFDGTLKLAPGADIALYSFGPIKTATALGGAIGLFRDPDLATRVERRMAQWPIRSDRWFMRRAAKFALLKLVSTRPIYSLLFAGLRWAGRDPDKALGSLARGFPSNEKITEAVRFRPPPRLLRLLGRRLTKWSPPSPATHSLLERLSARFTVPGREAAPPHWWLAPLLADDPDALVAFLRRQGFDATRGTTSMRALRDEAGSAPPNAGHLMEKVVYLPKPVDDRTGDRLAAVIERYVSAPSRPR